jgi:hypothetical protein
VPCGQPPCPKIACACPSCCGQQAAIRTPTGIWAPASDVTEKGVWVPASLAAGLGGTKSAIKAYKTPTGVWVPDSDAKSVTAQHGLWVPATDAAAMATSFHAKHIWAPAADLAAVATGAWVPASELNEKP